MYSMLVQMQKKEIITIAGKLGSGKSSTAKRLAVELGYDHFSSGDLFRAVAAEQNKSVLDANKNAEHDSRIDHLVDERLRDIGKHETKKVIDSRTAWHWMPNSFKVYLELPTPVAAERIIAKMHERQDANEDIPESVDAYAAQLEERLASENRRYDSLYGIDPSRPENYDLVIDTSDYSLEDVVTRIHQRYNEWLKN